MLPDSRIAALERYFGQVQQQKMQDVPILNPALQIQAVGFQGIAQGWLGVLITPWFMNLLWLPPFELAGADDKMLLSLPSGDYQFQRNNALEIGNFYTCSLFSPMHPFADHATAVLTAEAIMQHILKQTPSLNPSHGTATSHTRRDFLRGRFS